MLLNLELNNWTPCSNATYRKGGVLFYCHTLKLSGTNGIVGRDIALLLYMSHIQRGVARRLGKDAIHFDLKEGHERNKKLYIAEL